MALVWVTTDYLTTKLMYGSAFRAPSFTEQFGKNNPVVLGNPNLDPEKIDTTEISFAFSLNANLTTSLTLFDYHSRDMIEFVQDVSATTKTAANARDQDGQGFELEMGWKPLSQFYLAASYARQDARDSATDNRIADAPGEQFKLALDWEFHPDWFLHHQLHWVGDRARPVAPTAALQRPEIDDYALANLTLMRKNLLPDLDASLALRNLADADAREPSSGEIAQDYPLESRSLWVELRYSFY
jgi:iron complex outermembrane receptor protein